MMRMARVSFLIAGLLSATMFATAKASGQNIHSLRYHATWTGHWIPSVGPLVEVTRLLGEAPRPGGPPVSARTWMLYGVAAPGLTFDVPGPDGGPSFSFQARAGVQKFLTDPWRLGGYYFFNLLPDGHGPAARIQFEQVFSLSLGWTFEVGDVREADGLMVSIELGDAFLRSLGR